ncbi:MAG: Rrf2 family transcriptional regulator [Actinomycetota bacterium]|nr:Rrf2 family transcriptional regulator [Actinomycetota bacterium]
MWISKRTDYATRAVLVLALAGAGRPMTLDELARRTQVPASMLEQLMPPMRRDGIVRSVRGRYGGYLLNHDPADISLERVVRLFEGQLAPIGCATRSNPEACVMSVGCSLRGVWEDVRDTLIAQLERTTFADLAARAAGPWRDHDLLPVASSG